LQWEEGRSNLIYHTISSKILVKSKIFIDINVYLIVASGNQLGSIKTEILVAWIFALLVVIGWIIGLLVGIYYLIFFGILGGPYVGPVFLVTGIIYTVVFLILMIPSILVMNRTNRMRKAANKGEIDRLKELNSIGWAIVALIFSGIIPGVMLLIAHGPIEELGTEGEMSGDNLDRVLKLKSLMDSGVITKEEFEVQKNKLIHGSSSSDSVESKLKDLKSLLDSGAINQSEYDEQKRKLLEKL